MSEEENKDVWARGYKATYDFFISVLTGLLHICAMYVLIMCSECKRYVHMRFLATLVALHFTPVSESISGS